MTNIANILEAQLDAISLRQLRGTAAVAQIHGAQTYLVGGAVRDALLGLRVTDIDIAVVGMTSGLPRGVARALNGNVAARSQFNTFSLNVSGRHIDLAMARHESYARPGALPAVAPGTLQQDLARRDFAINAMAVSLAENSFGDLTDPFHGCADLESGVVRVLHDERFRDDATRILRAARYAVRLGFTLEAHTERLLTRDCSYLDTISSARLRDEFDRLLREGRAASILQTMDRLGALQSIHPALAISPRTLGALRQVERSDYAEEPSLLLSILAYDMDANEKTSFIERLRLSSRSAKIVLDTGLARSRILEAPPSPVLSRSDLYRRLNSLDESAVLGSALSAADTPQASGLMLFLDELRHIEPVLKGNDLLELGVPQGPLVGEMLKDLHTARLDDRVNTRQDEIDFVKARI